MNYQKAIRRITLVTLSTIAVIIFMLSIPFHLAEAKILFAPRIDYSFGSGHDSSVAIAKLDGDVDLDLVVNVGSGVWVLLGNGDGTFQSPVKVGEDGGGAIGDLNGDGKLDLAVANDGVWVLLGNGDGTFQDAVGYSTAGGFGGVSIGDVNGDGAPDLVTNKEDDEWVPCVWVLFGNGDGTFQSPIKGGQGNGGVTGDLNGDGVLDLTGVWTNPWNGEINVIVMLGNGDGTFKDPVEYDTGHQYPNSPTSGDLDGDGNLDLVVSQSVADCDLVVLLGNGDGTFRVGERYFSEGSASIAIGDLNKDGFLDLVEANPGCVVPGVPCCYAEKFSVLLGNGDGSFQNRVTYDVGAQPQSVAIGDLNGDGDLDLVVTSDGRVSIFINAGLATDIDLLYTPVKPCRIVDTRKTSAGMIGANTERNFHVFGDSDTIGAQGGNSSRCSSPMGEPLAAQINLVVVSPTGKGNMQAFAVGDDAGANFGVNFAANGSNRANAGIVRTSLGVGPDITVTSRFSSAHTVIDVLGYYYPESGLLYTPVTPCRIADTRKSGGIIGANAQRNFHVLGDSVTISAQGGDPSGCHASADEPLAVHINMMAVSPSGKGNMQAYPIGGMPGANFMTNFAAIGTNFSNAGTVQAGMGAGPDITVTSRFSAAHTVIDVLGYYYPGSGLLYAHATPCRIVDTRKTSAGMIDANTWRGFWIHGDGDKISAQGGDATGCHSPFSPLGAHVNLVVVNPTGKGNMQAGEGTGANLAVNFAAIGTNFANAGTLQASTSPDYDFEVISRHSSAHAVIDVLGYYYPAP